MGLQNYPLIYSLFNYSKHAQARRCYRVDLQYALPDVRLSLAERRFPPIMTQ
jgi:hypothetical protein